MVMGAICMGMEKAERLVLRITKEFKDNIENIAKEQGMSISEFVRKTLEDVVYRKDKEIEQNILMIQSIESRLKEVANFVLMDYKPNEIAQQDEEIMYYKKLLYVNQLKVIDLIIENENISKDKVKRLKEKHDDDVKRISSFIYLRISNIEEQQGYGQFEDRVKVLEESARKRASELYRDLCEKYRYIV